MDGRQARPGQAARPVTHAAGGPPSPNARTHDHAQEARDFRAVRDEYDQIVQAAVEDMRSAPPAPHCLMAHLLAVKDPATGRWLAVDGWQLGGWAVATAMLLLLLLRRVPPLWGSWSSALARCG